MADENVMEGTADGEAGAPVEMRPCSFCGNAIHPSSHRCTHCGGHVGISWGTVHGELFLFLFLAVLIVVGCLVSWTGRTPAPGAKEAARVEAEAVRRADAEFKKAVEDAVGAGKPVPSRDDPQFEPKTLISDVKVWDSVEPAGPPINGTDTLRGSLMLAIAAYGVIIGVMNLLYRRLVMWPFVISGMMALWVGMGGIFSAAKSSAWERWGKWAETHNFSEQLLGKIRAIPPGHLLLTIAGIVLMIKLVGGILAVATKGKPGGADAKDSGGASRRRREKGDAAADADAAAGAPGATTPPK